MPFKSIWTIVLFNSVISLWIFFFWMTYLLMRMGYWHHTIIVLGCVCVFMSSSAEIGYADIWCLYVYNYIFLMDCFVYQYEVTFFVSFDWFWLEVCFIWYEYSYPLFLLDSIYLEYLFPSLYFKLGFVFASEIHFLWATNDWVLFSPVCQSVSFI
jgi:hypothetical protein